MTPRAQATKAAIAADARLILQDPRAWEEAQTPVPRLSLELAPSSKPGMDRVTAQQTWQALQLQTDDVVALHTQLKEQSQQALVSGNSLNAARVEAVSLRSQLVTNEEQRFQHPLVYGLAAAALGTGLLWLIERKKRAAVQVLALLVASERRPTHSIPSQPVAAKLPTRTVASPKPAPARDTSSDEKQDIRFLPPLPWWKRVWPLGLASRAGRNPSASIPPSISSAISSLRSSRFKESDLPETTAAQAETDFFDPEFAQIDLFSQTRLKPSSPGDGMGHLLELRMASQALCALEQPVLAQRLLAQHIDAVPNTCAWAYLEYLSLCAQLDQREAFEATRMRYRIQFNRLAPYWMEPNSAVHGLDHYERPMAELCAAWPTERAKALLQTWLLGNLHARRLFQLPAYHDLLDLYELLEHLGGSATVAAEQDASFMPTVNLLDLDYEFAVDVKLDAQSEGAAMRAIPTVKTGDFAVDVNITQSSSQPVPLFPASLMLSARAPAPSLSTPGTPRLPV